MDCSENSNQPITSGEETLFKKTFHQVCRLIVVAGKANSFLLEEGTYFCYLWAYFLKKPIDILWQLTMVQK